MKKIIIISSAVLLVIIAGIVLNGQLASSKNSCNSNRSKCEDDGLKQLNNMPGLEEYEFSEVYRDPDFVVYEAKDYICAQALEPIGDDYYFNCIKSGYIYVYDRNSDTLYNAKKAIKNDIVEPEFFYQIGLAAKYN